MTIGMILCTLTLLLSVFIAYISSWCKKKVFYLKLNHSVLGKKANEISSSIMNSYGIESQKIINESENTKTEEIEDNNENKITEDNDDEEYVEDNKIKYEKIKEENDDTTNEENSGDEYTYVHKLDELENSYVINGNDDDFGVYLSKDLYSSDSVAAVSFAAYETTKLCESIGKPMWAKVISGLSIIPKIINQISWIICAFGMIGFLDIASNLSLYVGVISLVCILIPSLNWCYYSYIVSASIKNLSDNNLIADSDKKWCIEIMNKISLSDSLSYMKSMSWFLKKILGYRL